MAKPLIVILTGRPGSGKTTLAAKLAEELRCPLVSRDRIKEGMLRTLGTDLAADRSLTDRVFHTFFAEIGLLAHADVSLVAEAAFQHKVWVLGLASLRETTDLRIVVCEVSAELAWSRRKDRKRSDPSFARFHPDTPGKEIADEPYDPPKLDAPTLCVDTTEGYNPGLDIIKAFLG